MATNSQFNVTETNDSINIEVPFKGTRNFKPHIIDSPVFITINFRDFAVRLDLSKPIRPGQTTWYIEGSNLNVKCVKEEIGIWEGVRLPSGSLSNDELVSRRQESMKLFDDFKSKQIEEAKEKKRLVERDMVKKQMNVQDEEKRLLESLKEKEKHDAEEQVYAKFAKMQIKLAEEKKEEEKKKALEKEKQQLAVKIKEFQRMKEAKEKATTEKVSESSEVKASQSSEKINTKPNQSITTTIPSSTTTMIFNEEEQKLLKEEQERSVRQSNRVEITFTPRAFPTPMRESKKAEEEEWIRRNMQKLKPELRRQMRKAQGGDEDPFLLKGQGDDMFRRSDFIGAENAYSDAIEFSPADDLTVTLLSNRAATRLKLKRYSGCVEDTETALKLIDGDSLSHHSREKFRRDMKKKLTYRKALGLQFWGKLEEAHLELQRTLAMSPNDANIKQHASVLTIFVKSAALKKLADEFLKEKDYTNAKNKYLEVISLESTNVASLLNLGACCLALKENDDCVKSCKRGLEIMEKHETKSDVELEDVMAGPMPLVNSKVWKQWKAAAHARIGTALMNIDKPHEAIKHFESTISITPSNKKVQNQLDEAKSAIE
eukprot:TRINITY_DN159328_c0_g1_i1.p1 TRINITY_DN159328_c0_g1~~TRINITY_DN159328_c0_g1_i1.p1  ORF type:complete len:601 (-),score=184.00 TRINITY_DN159328_c0_g1_i1:127-1929(-)